MRRALLAPVPLIVVAIISATTGAAAQTPAAGEARWIAYVAGAPDEFSGALHLVRSDGRDDRTVVEDEILVADLGPGGDIAATHELPPEGADQPANGELLYVSQDGQPELLEDGDAYYLGVAAAQDGRLAFARQVTQQSDVPEHLEPALEDLAASGVPILAPPEEPPNTGSVVAESSEDGYNLLFTNDPEQDEPHAAQVNRFVQASVEHSEGGGAFTDEVEVRGGPGSFSCGASACFLTWQESEVYYTIGEFGDPDEAVEFAEALEPIEELAGANWQIGGEVLVPELAVRSPAGEITQLESVEGFCECAFIPVGWSTEGDTVLAITSAEGYTTLAEYPVGGGDPNTLIESNELNGRAIVDAAYGPGGAWMLLTGEGGPPGNLRSADGSVRIRGVRAFDIAASTLAYVNADGAVVVRDLATGTERTVAPGPALDVSIAPDTIERPAPPVEPASEDEGFPLVLVILLGVGAAALAGGAFMLGRYLARRR